MNIKKIALVAGAVITATIIAGFIIAPPLVEKSLNKIVSVDDYIISDKAQQLHQSLRITDWHADTLLWARSFLDRADYGQADLPRLQAGNVSLQVLTTVTKSPKDLNYTENSDTSDSITSLALVQRWPLRTWDSLLERALYQSERLHGFVKQSNGKMVFIASKADLNTHLQAGTPQLAVMLGTEGGHPFEGKVENIDRMFAAGFRMFGLTHFFDNELGGSLHGTAKAGLTDFGRASVKRLDALEAIIDLAHASELVAWEVLTLSKRPPVVSHTGLKGHCDTPRNFPDDLMKAIAEKGGLIAIGYWEEAACGATPDDIAGSIAYGINLLGADHVALGSDWDGTVTTLAANDLSAVTEALLRAGISEDNIRKVMGENSLRFLGQWLPDTPYQ